MSSSVDHQSQKIYLVLLYAVHFQRKNSEGYAEANKAHSVINYLESQSDAAVVLLPHIESGRLPKNAYGGDAKGTHRLLQLRALQKLALLVFLDFFQRGWPKLQQLRASWLEARRLTWQSYFDDIRPDTVLGIGLTEAEIIAARSHDIRTIEIQHGVFFEEKVEKYWPRIRPDYFCAWDLATERELKESRIKVIRIPYPVESRSRTSPGGHGVLVPLSWGKEPDASEGPFLGAMPHQLSQLLASEFVDSSNLIFRAHPVFPKKKLFKLERTLKKRFPGCQVRTPNHESFAEYLDLGFVILLHESSSWVEALQKSLPVITTSSVTFELLTASRLLTSRSLAIRLEEASKLPIHLSEVLASRRRDFAPRPKSSEETWSGLEKILSSPAVSSIQ